MRDCHVLIQMVNITVMSYINHQGSIVEPACLAGQREGQMLNVPQGVLDTNAEVRDSSTRRLYALKRKVFTSWCKERNEDPASCVVSIILFLQDCFDNGCTTSTLNVYVAAISAFHLPIDCSVGKHNFHT